MPNPEFKDIPEEQWELVATNVVSGQVHKARSISGQYLQTYVISGDDAPEERDEGVPAFIESDTEQIMASQGIDVYIWADNPGRVRVDV